MMLRRLILALSLLAGGACGGKVVGPEESTEGPSHEVDGIPSDETPGSDNSVGLPPCSLGFLRADEPGRLCMWITDDGRCYATKLDACACACRATSGDSCLSPYQDAPESEIPVDCF